MFWETVEGPGRESKPKKATARPPKPVAEKAAGPRHTRRPSREVCPPRPGLGNKRSGLESPDCGGEGKVEAKRAQRAMWDRGQVPDTWPRAYEAQTVHLDPERPPTMTPEGATKSLAWWRSLPSSEQSKRKAEKPNPSEIPVEEFGDPDLAWFVDPRVAGARAGKILVMFSGGKDSLALLLYVLEVLQHVYGIDPRTCVEVWHQAVDGRPESLGGEPSTVESGGHRAAKWDWPITEAYVIAVCECLGLPLYFGWREGGLQGNVLKGELRPEGRPQAFFELPVEEDRYSGAVRAIGQSRPGRSEERARMSYPLISADLSARWCSSEAKIDVAESQLSAREDLDGKRFLYVSGERAEESSNRAGYAEREFFASWVNGRFSGKHGVKGRYVEKWRPIHKWCELDVWAIIARWGIRAHPAYSIGFGRLSCMTCIFGSPRQWASIQALDPKRFAAFSRTEQVLLERKEEDVVRGVQSAEKRLPTIKSQKQPKREGGRVLPVTIQQFCASSEQYEAIDRHPQLAREALSTELLFPILQRPWQLPAGAFGEDTGPT